MVVDFDVIVVGAGIFGSCTAYHCQKLGLKTLLLEQFKLGHSNGSSHGKSRITRYAHTEKEYVPLVSDAYTQIAELEKVRDEKLWKRTGLLWVSDVPEIQKISDNLTAYNINHQVLAGSEVAVYWQQFDFGNNWMALVDPEGGVIYADKWLYAFRDEFKKLGGIIQDDEGVVSYKENGETIHVETTKRSYTTSKIILTVGAWITDLLPDLHFDINPVSIAVCYWKAKNPEDNQLLDENHYPVVIAQDNELDQFHFSLPDTDYPGLIKFCYHTGDTMVNNTHPEKPSDHLIKLPSEYIAKHIPVLDSSAPAKIDTCKYTVSPDDHYIIGRIPNKNPNILVGGCGSGSGFKVAPGIGKALAEMAAGKSTTVDVTFFSASRFSKK